MLLKAMCSLLFSSLLFFSLLLSSRKKYPQIFKILLINLIPSHRVMVSNLRYSAAKTSVIRKSSGLAALKKLLPTQSQFRKNVAKLKAKEKSKSSTTTTTKKAPERLEVLGYNVELDYALLKKTDILTAIDTVLNNQWTESSQFHHNKYHSSQSIAQHTPEELLFLLHGISMEVKADIMKYRHLLATGLVTVNQLYSIYEQEGHTYVDRSLELMIQQGKVKKFIISNASPVILHSPQAFQLGKVTYGYENIELVVRFEHFIAEINKSIDQLDPGLYSADISAFRTLKKFVIANPLLLFISETQLVKADLNLLVKWGFLTLTSNHLNEIDTNQYEIAFPNCGSYLKLLNNCRVWLIKLFSRQKHKEYLESDIWEKWLGNSGDKCKMTNFRPPFYGFELNWVFADALGAGVMEVFLTPMGRGWRLTGKM